MSFSFNGRALFAEFVIAMGCGSLLLAGACGGSVEPARDARDLQSEDGGTAASDGGDGARDAGRDGGSGPAGGQSGSDELTPPPAAELSARSNANVLFSGHSLLDNPITDWTAAIALAKGDTIGWEQQIINGSPIRVRTRGNDSGSSGFSGYQQGKNRSGSNRDLLAEIAQPTQLASGQKYDSLLITERYNPLDTAQWENGIGYLRHYHDRLTAANANARTYFYQCWPDIDKSAPEDWIAYQKVELFVWECIAAKVNLSLVAENKSASVRVIPGGVALAELVKKAIAGEVPGLSGSTQEKLDRIFTDNVHLGSAGQYLIAAVHYASLYGKSPVGAHATSELSADTANALETIAWDVEQNYAKSSPGVARTMADCRAQIASDVCPSYYSVRGLSIPSQGCSYWSGANSPFTFPDSKLPLPAP